MPSLYLLVINKGGNLFLFFIFLITFLLYKKLNYSTRLLTKQQQQQKQQKMRAVTRIYNAKMPSFWNPPRRPAANYVNMDNCIGAGAIIMSEDNMLVFGYHDSHGVISQFISFDIEDSCRDPRYLASKNIYGLSAGLIKINYTELSNKPFIDLYPFGEQMGFVRCYFVIVNGLDDLLFRRSQLRYCKIVPYNIRTFTKIVKVPVTNSFDLARGRSDTLTDTYGDQYSVADDTCDTIKIFIGRLFDR